MSERGDVVVEQIIGRRECFAIGAIVKYIDTPGYPHQRTLEEDVIGAYEVVDCTPIEIDGQCAIKVRLRAR